MSCKLRKITIYLACAFSIFLTGCANNTTLYEWNQYRDHMFEYAQQQNTNEQMLQFLLEAEQASKESGRRLAPGLYAEIGTFYLRAGSKTDAIKYYELEAAAWPESKAFMSVLVENLKKQQ